MHCSTFLADVYRRFKLRGQLKKEPELVGFLVHRLGVYPKDLDYYLVACSPRSMPLLAPSGKAISNERLEFLGDAVLELVVSEHIIRRFPFRPEGDLTRLRSLIVSRSSFNDISVKLGLADILRHRHPTIGFTQRMLGDTLEAFFGAMLLDRGFKCTQRVFEQRVLAELVDFNELLNNLVDSKTKLLEWSQQKRVPVDYETIRDPNRCTQFICKVFVRNQQYASGVGTTKKEAEQVACHGALDRLKRDRKNAAFKDEGI